MAKEKRFRLHYYVRNAGDGSAYPRFHGSHAEAKTAEDADFEETGECWGEPSAGHVELKVLDGKIFYRNDEWTGREIRERWLPVEED